MKGISQIEPDPGGPTKLEENQMRPKYQTTDGDPRETQEKIVGFHQAI